MIFRDSLVETNLEIRQFLPEQLLVAEWLESYPDREHRIRKRQLTITDFPSNESAVLHEQEEEIDTGLLCVVWLYCFGK